MLYTNFDPTNVLQNCYRAYFYKVLNIQYILEMLQNLPLENNLSHSYEV